PALLVSLMERSAGATRPAYLLHALGLAHYRAGQYQKAITYLEQSRKKYPLWDQETIVNGFVLALAHYRLGHEKEARQELNETVEQLERGLKAKAATASFPAHIVDWLSCQIL